MSSPATAKIFSNPIRYSDIRAELWLWSGAPITWQDKVTVEFRNVGFQELCPAHTLKHWDVIGVWANEIACRRAIPPLVVTEKECGAYYVHDGNHRLEAMRVCFRNRLGRLQVRVAVLMPKKGYCFSFRQYRTHWTYVLEAEKVLIRATPQPSLAPPAAVYSEVLHG